MSAPPKPSQVQYLELLRDMERRLDTAVIAWAREVCPVVTLEQATRLIRIVSNISGSAAHEFYQTGLNADAINAAQSDAAKTA